MAMGKRKRDRQPTMWVATTNFPKPASHPFYTRLNQLLHEHGFDDFAEGQCASFYAETIGRPGLPPGTYFRLLLIGYFEGIDSERGIAWRAADSFALHDFLALGFEDAPPDHSTISRTRRLIDVETHRATGRRSIVGASSELSSRPSVRERLGLDPAAAKMVGFERLRNLPRALGRETPPTEQQLAIENQLHLDAGPAPLIITKLAD
jgi:hypothetical protein